MAYVANDGPPDIDAKHAWVPAAGTSPPVLNDPGAGGPPPLPWVKVTAIDGFRDMPEMVDNRAPRTFGAGEITYPARVLGKTLVYQCEIRAASRESVRGTLSALLRGYYASRSDEGTMTITPYTIPGGVVWTYTARCLAIDADSSFSLARGVWGPYRWGLTISLRMSDPLFYTGGTGYA